MNIKNIFLKCVFLLFCSYLNGNSGKRILLQYHYPDFDNWIIGKPNLISFGLIKMKTTFRIIKAVYQNNGNLAIYIKYDFMKHKEFSVLKVEKYLYGIQICEEKFRNFEKGTELDIEKQRKRKLTNAQFLSLKINNLYSLTCRSHHPNLSTINSRVSVNRKGVKLFSFLIPGMPFFFKVRSGKRDYVYIFSIHDRHNYAHFKLLIIPTK